MKRKRRNCPDCSDQELVPIQVIDIAQGGGNVGFTFTAAGAERSVWTGYTKKVQGVVQGLMCEACGRVLLYAMTADEAEAMLEGQAERRAAPGGSLELASAAEEVGGLSHSD